MTVRVSSSPAGAIDDRSVAGFLAQSDHLRLTAIEYGARVTSLDVRLPDDTWRSVQLSLGDLGAYLGDTASVGAIVGRYANRIRGAAFPLDGIACRLEANEGRHHLHGGSHGFANQLWQGQVLPAGVRFRLDDPPGQHGYPGRLDVSVDFLLDGRALEIRFVVSSDADTVVNLTHHGYFNLAGAGTIADHRLQILADERLELDADRLPTGRLLPVEGTPFDLRDPARLGERLKATDLMATKGFDHCYAARSGGGEVAPVARLAASGIRMTVATSEPGVQLYTGNHLPQPHTALCLETQHFPDSPNQPHFPSTRLSAGEVRRSVTRFEFEIGSGR